MVTKNKIFVKQTSWISNGGWYSGVTKDGEVLFLPNEADAPLFDWQNLRHIRRFLFRKNLFPVLMFPVLLS